jgi:DNA-binding MarR family transcriptional regulator
VVPFVAGAQGVCFWFQLYAGQIICQTDDQSTRWSAAAYHPSVSQPAAVERASAPSRSDSSNLGWQLSTLFGTYLERAAAAVAELPGGPRGYQVLLIASRGSFRNQAEIAEHLRIDRTVMTYLLDDLEGARLIKRQPDPADRRSRQIVLTAKGSRSLTELTERIAAVERELLVDLTESEARQLRALLTRVTRSAAEGGPGVSACSVADDQAAGSGLGNC